MQVFVPLCFFGFDLKFHMLMIISNRNQSELGLLYPFGYMRREPKKIHPKKLSLSSLVCSFKNDSKHLHASIGLFELP